MPENIPMSGGQYAGKHSDVRWTIMPENIPMSGGQSEVFFVTRDR